MKLMKVIEENLLHQNQVLILVQEQMQLKFKGILK